MRKIIAELVGSIQPFDALESKHINYTLAWIESGAQLCRAQKPDIPPQHLVAYFVLYDALCEKLLLVDHKKAGLWLPGGGHVEPEEHPQTTVSREAMEELQIKANFCFTEPLFLTVTETVGSPPTHIDISLWYLLAGDSTQPLWFDSEEFYQIWWFAVRELPFARGDPHLARFVAKLKQQGSVEYAA